MIPAGFDYHRPGSIDEALNLLSRHGLEAKVLAGGHSLIPMMKLRLAAPAQVVDIGGINELRGIERKKKDLVIGALTPHADIAASRDVRKTHGALAQAAAAIGDVQVRNCGTLGGSLAHADPAADYPAAVLAFEAEIEVRGPKGSRTVPAGEFFQGIFTTALQPDELVTAVRFPEVKDAGSAYEKVAQPASGFAVVGVCAIVGKNKNGKIEEVRCAATGLADRPVRLTALEEALDGAEWSEETVAKACERADDGVERVRADLYAKEDYRRHLLRVLAKRAVVRAGA